METPINFVNILNQNSNQFCNFGLSGIDINDYINRFLYIYEKIELKEAIFFI